jgi:hypothetical protein
MSKKTLTLSESIRQKARQVESADDPLEATVLSVTPLQIHIVELDLTVDEENITLSTVAPAAVQPRGL